MSEQRAIVHFDLDAFFVAVECKKNSALLGKPVLIGGGERGVVAAASYEARAFGIHSAMPMRTARMLCPHAIVISGDYEDYSKHSQLVTEILREKLPLLEKASIDEFYGDLSGMDRFYGIRRYAKEVRNLVVKESGLSISYAVAGNKLVSKVATNEVKPAGQIAVPFGSERGYLAPLKIEKLPGVGAKTAVLLHDMGIGTIRTLSEVPAEMMLRLLGKGGLELSRRANGIDESPIVPFHEQKSISSEETFENDTIDIRLLEAKLTRLTEKVAYELRQLNRLTGCVSVKLRYSDFNTVSRQVSILHTSSDGILLAEVKRLFSKLYDRRLLVRLVGVRFTELVSGNHQINLFEETQEQVKLYQAMDSLRRQFGTKAVMRAGGLY